MSRIPEEENRFQENITELGSEICALAETVREPFLVLDSSFVVLAANESFLNLFEISCDITGLSVKDPAVNFRSTDLDFLLEELQLERKNLKDRSVSFRIKENLELDCFVNASLVTKGTFQSSIPCLK